MASLILARVVLDPCSWHPQPLLVASSTALLSHHVDRVHIDRVPCIPASHLHFRSVFESYEFNCLFDQIALVFSNVGDQNLKVIMIG
jgi:hypothetical protein